MSFNIVLGLVAILIIMLETFVFMLRNEIVQANYAVKGEAINHLAEAAVEEVVMQVRQQMNHHKGIQAGTFYGLFRAGVTGGTSPAVDCPITKEMAKKLYGITNDKIDVRADFVDRNAFDTDMMGEKRKVPASSKGCSGSLRITATIDYDGYRKRLEVRKDVKCVRVLPPYPDFALVVRDGGYPASGGSPGANYNQWQSYQGGEKTNLTVLTGEDADAAKNGKILFGGGLNEQELTKLIPDPYPKTEPMLSAWMSGWIPPPTLAQMKSMGLKQWPIIVNLTNYGVNNYEVGHLFESSIQSIPEYAGMTPTSDFHAYGTEKDNLGEMVAPVPTQRIPYELPVVKTKPPADGDPAAPPKTETEEVELTFFRATLGMGEEIAQGPEKVKPYGFFGDKKGEGFRNYFGEYYKIYKETPFDPTGSGLDLVGSDPTDSRDHNKRPNRNVMIYGNVIGSYLTAHVAKIEKGEAKAAALPWIDLSKKSGIDEMQILLDPPWGGKLPKEFMTSLSVGSVLKAGFNKIKSLFGGKSGSTEKINYPHCGKEEATEPFVTVPPVLLEPWRGDGMDSIYYRQFMSGPKFFPADPQMFGASQTPGSPYAGKMVFRREYVSPLTGNAYDAAKFNEIIPPELFDLSPDMAAYKFVGPMEFIMYLQNNGMMFQDSKTGIWDLYLDGIWFVQGLITDGRYDTLALPPPSYEGQPAGTMRVHGKGLIATIEGTDVTVGGIVESGDDAATQLSIVVAPTRVLFNLMKLHAQSPDLIPLGMSLSGNIIMTDQPAQASICSPMGGLMFKDDPTWDKARAEQTYGKGATFDKFYALGNVIVNRLDQAELRRQRKSDNTMIGGGVVKYDPNLIRDAFGQEDAKNYHVSMGQRCSYFDWTTLASGKDDTGKPEDREGERAQ